MDVLNTYTSTGSKLIHHPFLVDLIQKGFGTPITLQIAPTSKCNLNCVFCSNINRDKDESLEINKLENLLIVLSQKGLKAIEITGGGDPTCYAHINDLIKCATMLNLDVGLITNGIAVKDVLNQESLGNLKWMRVSLNSLDYVRAITLPKIKGVLGFSYVMNEKTTDSIITKLRGYAQTYDAKYIRIVPNCQTSIEQQIENNKVIAEQVMSYGPPFFYQPKVFEKPKKCWWCYFKPFLLHNGWVYPCSSVVLNDAADRKFHEKYQWIYMDDLLRIYQIPMVPFDSSSCTHCVFSQQNKMVDDIINPSGMENFI